MFHVFFHNLQIIINATRARASFLGCLFLKAFGINNSEPDSASSEALPFLKIPWERRFSIRNLESQAPPAALSLACKKTHIEDLLITHEGFRAMWITTAPRRAASPNSYRPTKRTREETLFAKYTFPSIDSNERVIPRKAARLFSSLEEQPSICRCQFSMFDRMLIQSLPRKQWSLHRN